ncbi:quinone-dependent dihydroorotate dehydrogenase [Pelagibacteraceae bacterium]|nr:quinone-dependent dihydroorotate dehydrogenase [Pelagibacteraceae bacterium]
MFSLLRPYIFGLDPEVAHDLAIKSLKFNVLPKSFFQVDGEELLETDLFKRKLKNPIGLAAGFDKSAEVYNPLFKLGFGFVEVGTVTPRRQTGNPKPRIFRLERDNAMINRLGFNNDGMETVSERLAKFSPEDFLGINVGPNKDTKDKTADFIRCFEKLNKFADYVTINISSPNTEGLRDFHEKTLLSNLLSKLNELKKNNKIYCPVVLKISPDIDEKEISNLNELILKFKVDGIILTNTTDKHREHLSDAKKGEIGGLSGLPLQKISLKLIKNFYKLNKRKVSIIGVGGIDSGQSAFEKIAAGATVIQLYTGMVYKGPGVVKDIKKELIEILKKEKIKNIKEVIGINS